MIVHLLLQGTKLLTLFKTKLLSNCSALEFADYLDRKMAEGAKIFNDPVHGHIEMPELCVRIIDTPQFQRLRNIKQLGGCYFVYPGASHNRFEHSIGTAHLAGCLVERLQTNQPDLKISKEDVLCVKIAGLCHDLGHGPFSHLFDGPFIRKAAQKNTDLEDWKHEQASLKMFDIIYQGLKDDFKKNNLKDKDVTFIKELIDSKKKTEEFQYKGRGREKGFLYQIISNKDSGVDVDKWDYFARDCHHIGIKSSFDHKRCIKMARVIKVGEGENWQLKICYREKEAYHIYEMFHLRASLHRHVYQHKTWNAISLMITDALIKADEHLKLSTAINDMEAYTELTDHVYYQILYSTENDLQEAKAILKRIESRDLYRLICERDDEITRLAKKKISFKGAEEEILKEAKMDDVKKEDIILDKAEFDYGMKEEDPVTNVFFYTKQEPDKAFQLTKAQVSHMLPEVFRECKIRLYLCKNLDEDQKKQLIKGFDEWWSKQQNFL